MGLAPADFGELVLSAKATAARVAEFVQTGRGYRRLRLLIRELASICSLPAYVTSPTYRAPVDRSLRLLQLVLDPAFVPDRLWNRRLALLVLRYLREETPSPGPRIIRTVVRFGYEAVFTTFPSLAANRTWSEVAFVKDEGESEEPHWFVPLTVLASGAGGSLRPEPAGDTEISRTRMFHVVGRHARGLLAHQVDADGLSWIRCSTPKLGAPEIRLATSLFCVINGVQRARLDGRVLETSLG
jgi:hypothetical protein